MIQSMRNEVVGSKFKALKMLKPQKLKTAPPGKRTVFFPNISLK